MAFWQETEDWHTEGEPFRIVHRPPPGFLRQDLTVSQQRLHIMDTPNHPLDVLRQSLCHEPRGHADMYGGFITPPNDSEAHFGVLFFHSEGFSTACGHGTIAVGYWALANGLVQMPEDGTVDVVIDVPSGRVKARATCKEAKLVHVDFVNVPSYHIESDIPVSVTTPSGQSLSLDTDLAFGGAVYAAVDVNQLSVAIEPENHRVFVELQRQIKKQLAKFVHNDKYEVYGVCFYSPESADIHGITQRNVVVFADGQIDRSPCGSGTSARLASLWAQKKITSGQVLTHRSIIGTKFEARVIGDAPSLTEHPGCVTEVRGTARLVARSNFHIDPSDAVYPGFLFR